MKLLEGYYKAIDTHYNIVHVSSDKIQAFSTGRDYELGVEYGDFGKDFNIPFVL